MRKKNLLIIFILVTLISMSGCTKKSDDKVTPIEPTEPDIPTETIAK